MTAAYAFYTSQALAKSTQSSYAHGAKVFRTFAAMCGVPKLVNNPELPFCDEEVLCYFVSHCVSHLHLSYPTIKLYLAGIRNMYIHWGGTNPLVHVSGRPLYKLEMLLRGVKKTQAQARPLRDPITVNILNKLAQKLDHGYFGPYTDKLMKAACFLAFFGFLRCGEFTCPSYDFDPGLHLCLKDVTVYPQFIGVNIKVSKTDPFRQGCVIKLFKTGSPLCPYSALLQFLQVRHTFRNSSLEPFFLLPDFLPLTRGTFAKMLNELCRSTAISTSSLNTHSFRIGAATTAAANKTPEHLIQTLGRWSSDCYRRYIRTSDDLIAQTQLAMSIPHSANSG